MLARLVLAAGIAACLATWALGTRIAYFDYDDATQGIFINDLSFRGDFDASFEGRPGRQDRYRTRFAAQRLAFSLPLSWLQRGLGLERWQVEDLLRAAALGFALAGSWLAARTLLPAPRFGAAERWALIAALAAHPSLALFARTGAAFYVAAYALFWLASWTSCRWLESGRASWLCAAGGAAALCALNPYPPLVVWPLALALAAAWQGQLRAALRSPQIYAALAGAALAAVTATALLATRYDDSLAHFLARLAEFRADRGHSLGLAPLLAHSPLDKFRELLDQQLWFRPNRLGDRSRDDSVWVLGAAQPAIWLFSLAALAGLAAALRERAPEDRRALAFTSALLLVFFSVSFPEGRFVLALLPCWAYFALRGIERCFHRAEWRAFAVGGGLILLAAGTEYAIHTTYLPRVLPIWSGFEGMRGLAQHLAAEPDAGRGSELALPYPRDWVPELYFRMLMPEGAEWLPPRRLEQRLAAPVSARPLVALVYAEDATALARFADAGFTRGGELRGEASGRSLWLLKRSAAALPGAAGAAP